MPEARPKSKVTVKDFPGLNLESDPHDLSPGTASVQLNIDSSDVGRLKSRLGFKVVSFESDS
jgi:hypothetical protein